MAHPLKSAIIDSRDAKLHKIAKTTRMTAGAETGKGRLQKAALQKKLKGKNFIVEGTPTKVRADRRARGGKIKFRADGGSIEDQSTTPAGAAPAPTFLDKLATTWPARLVKSAVSGATLPGDVYAGKVAMTDPETGHTSPELMQRTRDLAGLVGEAGIPMAQPGSLGMAGGKLGSRELVTDSRGYMLPLAKDRAAAVKAAIGEQGWTRPQATLGQSLMENYEANLLNPKTSQGAAHYEVGPMRVLVHPEGHYEIAPRTFMTKPPEAQIYKGVGAKNLHRDLRKLDKLLSE